MSSCLFFILWGISCPSSSGTFYVIAGVFFSTLCCSFLESPIFLLLLIYIIFFCGKQTIEDKKSLPSSGAFVGDVHVFLFKLQMPSNMPRKPLRTPEKQGMKLSGLLPGLPLKTITNPEKGSRGIAVWIWWCWFWIALLSFEFSWFIIDGW